MNAEKDPYWDELGVAWLTVNPDPKALRARLNARLKAQAMWAQVLMGIGWLLCVAMLFLGVFTVYIGFRHHTWNLVIRGIALLLLAVLGGIAAWAQRIRDRGHLASVTELIESAITRSRGFRRAASVGVAMCGVAAVFGVAGYLVRVRFGNPPAMSPWEPLALLALTTTALMAYLRLTVGDLDRLCYLRRTLSPETGRDEAVR